MTNYFYGLAANPFTLAHEEIVKNVLAEDPQSKVILGITEHDYKKIDLPWDLRKTIVEENLKQDVESGRVVIVKQNCRTYMFLTNFHEKIDYVIVGEDEWKDLQAGKWHYSDELLKHWKFKVIPRVNGISATKVRELLRNKADFSELKNLISKKTYEIVKTEF